MLFKPHKTVTYELQFKRGRNSWSTFISTTWKSDVDDAAKKFKRLGYTIRIFTHTIKG